MAQRFKIENGPTIVELEETVIGSEVTPIAIHLEEETAPGSEIFVNIDLTGKSLSCLVKLHPEEQDDSQADGTFTIVPRIPTTGGWLDLYLDGDVTLTFEEKIYEASLKIWPTGSPELGDTMVVIRLPMKYRATR